MPQTQPKLDLKEMASPKTNSVSAIAVCVIWLSVIGFLPWIPYSIAVDRNPCATNPCRNEGECIVEGQSFRCNCPIVYSGAQCEIFIGDRGCSVSLCQNNATCVPGDGTGILSFSCQCVPGMTGTYCETNIDECALVNGPCFNGGVCVDGVNQYTCNCSGTGYEGETCVNEINECLNSPCGVGTCRNQPGSFTCDCPEGYFGTPCERVLACDSSPCQHNGACENQGAGYKCSCALGYTGTNCESAVDRCLNVTCEGEHVICESGVTSHRCICKPGYIGLPGNCTEFNECASRPCHNGATCVNRINGYECVCVRGFNGTNCKDSINECASNPCQERGSCEDGLGDFTCNCNEGYTGKTCETNINECLATSTNPCLNGGTCEDQIGGITCSCVPGYTGLRCETDINECDAQPCQNQGTCRNLLNNYTCDCAPGYTGMNCSTDIDDCSPNPCQNGGTCTDGVTTFDCRCTDEWMGETCTQEYDACSFAPCQNGGTCSSVLRSQEFTCTCVSGYTGANCSTNIDDCIGITCPQYQICHDLINDHFCDCPTGYKGAQCSEEVDECAGSPCTNNGTCIDGLGFYTCKCQASTVNLTRYLRPGQSLVFQTGYTGQNCEEDIDECAISPSVCLHDGTCENTNGSFTCGCRGQNGIYYTGQNCELTTNYCLAAPVLDPPACWNNATCKAGSRNYTCICAPGFEGQRCKTNIDECQLVRDRENKEPCANNGTCFDGINKYTCECIPGITGHNCTVNIDDCSPDPCQNGGRCIDRINSYTCNCDGTGFEGENCTVDIDDCLGNPCQNGASCQDKIKDYNCTCFDGFSGKNCDTDINECEQNPCENGGSCFERSKDRFYPDNPIPGNFSLETAGGFFCHCPPGFNGSQCEFNIDECLLETQPCYNGGRCLDGVNRFSCDCAPGFQGDRCLSEINECLVYQPCRNGATCHDQVADYFCQCLPSLNRVVYGGKNCSLVLTGCLGNQCQNGAKCVPTLADEASDQHNYTCDCLPGWAGRLCQEDTSLSFYGDSFIYHQGPLSNLTTRFRTTVEDGVLNLLGSSPQNFLSVEMMAGQICLNGTGTFRSPPPCLPIEFNDGQWHSLDIQLTDTSLTISLQKDPLCLNQICIISFSHSTVIEDVTLGGVGIFNDVTEMMRSKKNFIGCLQDVMIDNARPVYSDPSTRRNVSAGCQRDEQCTPDTCQGKGTCVDMWFTPKCVCDRPYYGKTCDKEIPPVTFGSGENVSLVSFVPPTDQVEILWTDLQLSFFFTTRKPSGVLFFMGGQLEELPQQCLQRCNYLLLYLKSGQMCIKFRVCSSGDVERCSPQHVTYNDGNTHFLEVDRKVRELSIFVDGIAMFDKVIFFDAGGLCHIMTDHFSFGSLPGLTAQRRKRQTKNPEIYDGMTRFKGVFQDLRVNGDLLLMYNLRTPSADLPESFPLPNGTSTILEGIVNDDVCGMSQPCLNNATCENVIYNDYNCSCPEGFTGKDCGIEDVCKAQPCPGNATCKSLQGGYECVTSATFSQGGLYYEGVGLKSVDVNSVSLRLRTREQSGTIFLLRSQQQLENEYLVVHLENGSVKLTYALGQETKSLTGPVVVSDGLWHSVIMKQFPGRIQLFVDNKPVSADDNSVQTLAGLISGTNAGHANSTELLVGSNPTGSSHLIGCLDEIRINDLLLPFFSDTDLQIPSLNNATQRFRLKSQTEVIKGCNSQMSYCDAYGCHNGGTCTELWNDYHCDCPIGFDGRNCDNDIDDCINHDCQNGATCVDGLNNITCNCIPGYYGWRCEAQRNECENLPCRNGGLCIDELNDYSCNCTSNYTGKNCDILITETCDREPCQNGATCQDYNETISGQEVARFNCTCAPGYEGKTCEDEIDYCADFPCRNGATCQSNVTLLDYICLCHPGYTDKNCSTDIDECEPGPCQNGGICTDLINGYNCTCTSGWEGVDCDVDILECNQTINPCGDRGECVEKPGSFECDCDPGFTGIPCVDINECDIGQCKNGAGCENTIGDYSCNCTLGYEGKDCDIANCSYNQCLMGSTCRVEGTIWECDCLPFYEGKQCEIRGPCVSAPCSNGATCEQNVLLMNYTCHCTSGFKGDNCEENRNECVEDNPCLNNSTCNDTFGSYNCACAVGFTGKNCGVNIDDCIDEPCENEGTCIDLVNGFDCNCTDTGYEGATCSEDIDECAISSVCQHGGTCINEPGAFTCQCAKGYAGDLCERKEAQVGGPEDDNTISIIVGSVVGFLVLVIIICVIVFLVMARNKRATRGTYSPSRQEMSGSRVELGHVIKPPPEERLI
ncbi:protein crumbs-like isoform X2 [Liolophura sinensis]|uniref:protein crumbs-like isoform X2 n=1 Tax=Liolophura sinensis TaxID=3198878 RepID=UPI003158529F